MLLTMVLVGVGMLLAIASIACLLWLIESYFEDALSKLTFSLMIFICSSVVWSVFVSCCFFIAKGILS